MTGREHGQEPSEDICDFAGHEWADAGGGLSICLVCEAEKWADSDDPVTVHGGHVPEREDWPGG